MYELFHEEINFVPDDDKPEFDYDPMKYEELPVEERQLLESIYMNKNFIRNLAEFKLVKKIA